jgi:hypothetical protein
MYLPRADSESLSSKGEQKRFKKLFFVSPPSAGSTAPKLQVRFHMRSSEFGRLFNLAPNTSFRTHNAVWCEIGVYASFMCAVSTVVLRKLRDI